MPDPLENAKNFRLLSIGDDFSTGKKLLCPACSSEKGHIQYTQKIDSHDNYEAWTGRGDLYRTLVDGECGHNWYLCIGEHNGLLIIYAEIQP